MEVYRCLVLAKIFGLRFHRMYLIAANVEVMAVVVIEVGFYYTVKHHDLSYIGYLVTV